MGTITPTPTTDKQTNQNNTPLNPTYRHKLHKIMEVI